MSWRDAMNDDIKRFFDIDETAEVIEIDTETQERGYGCSTCRWTVFVIEVTFRTESGTRTKTYEGSMSEFLTAVSEAGEQAQAEATDSETEYDRDEAVTFYRY